MGLVWESRGPGTQDEEERRTSGREHEEFTEKRGPERARQAYIISYHIISYYSILYRIITITIIMFALSLSL